MVPELLWTLEKAELTSVEKSQACLIQKPIAYPLYCATLANDVDENYVTTYLSKEMPAVFCNCRPYIMGGCPLTEQHQLVRMLTRFSTMV